MIVLCRITAVDANDLYDFMVISNTQQESVGELSHRYITFHPYRMCSSFSKTITMVDATQVANCETTDEKRHIWYAIMSSWNFVLHSGRTRPNSLNTSKEAIRPDFVMPDGNIVLRLLHLRHGCDRHVYSSSRS